MRHYESFSRFKKSLDYIVGIPLKNRFLEGPAFFFFFVSFCFRDCPHDCRCKTAWKVGERTIKKESEYLAPVLL